MITENSLWVVRIWNVFLYKEMKHTLKVVLAYLISVLWAIPHSFSLTSSIKQSFKMHLDVFPAVSLATLKLCVVHGQKHVFGCTAGMDDEMRMVLKSLLLWLHPVTNNRITWDIILCLICSTTLHYNCMKVYSVVSLLRFQNPEIRYPIETAVFFYPRNILVPKLFRMKLSAKLMWCKNYKCVHGKKIHKHVVLDCHIALSEVYLQFVRCFSGKYVSQHFVVFVKLKILI